ARVVGRHVDAAVAEAEIVDDAGQLIGGDDLMNRFADTVAELCRVLDAGAGLRPHVDLDLPAIDGREKVLAEIRGEPERQEGKAKEAGDHLAAVLQTQLQKLPITSAHRLED